MLYRIGPLTLLLSALALLVPLAQAQVISRDPVNDPLYSQQRDYFSRIGIPTVWHTTKGSSDVKIAVIAPGGIRTTHEDLTAKTTVGAARYGWGYFPQGTISAGIAAAATNNGKGIAGVNWHAPLLSYDPTRWQSTTGALGFVTLDVEKFDDDVNQARQDGADVLLIDRPPFFVPAGVIVPTPVHGGRAAA